MNTFGLTDSMACLLDKPEHCEQCGSVSRLASGLCMGCLMRAGLDQQEDDLTESFVSLLATIDIHDSNWRIGNYEILEEIGRGGMGVIYRARERHSRRIVALKRVLSYHSDSPGTLSRFRREAEAAASLDHPNILPIYEVGESEDGLPFFSMKYAPGGSLLHAEKFLRGEPRRCVALMAKVARAVQYAHGQGILHRDLKPGNILLDGRGEPLVSDFGLAKWLDTTSDLTRTLTIFGTPGFIAPEQAKGPAAKLTPAADVYSLGAILFDLFTGRPPFVGEHALAVIQQASEKPAPKLRSLAPTLDRDLETICARCLEREPAARYQSAAALAHDLECWLEGKPIKARRVLPPTRMWRWSRRNPVLVGTAAACLFLGAASIWFLWQEGWMQQISIATKKLLLSPRQAAEQSKLRQALLQYPESHMDVDESDAKSQSAVAIEERLYSILATSVGIDAKILSDKLPKFSQAVKRDPDASSYERACAAYLGKDYAEAERLFLRALDEDQRASPTRSADIIQALTLAGWSARKLDEFARAREHLAEAEKLTDRQRDPREWADVRLAVVNVLLAGHDHPGDAEKLIRSVIQVRTQVYGPEHRETLYARRRLARSLQLQGKYAEAEAELRELVNLKEKILGPENPETLLSRRDLVLNLLNAHKLTDGLVEAQRLLKLQEKVLGPEHPHTLAMRGNVAQLLSNFGRFSESIAQWRELIKAEDKVLGPDDEMKIRSIGNLASTLARTGEYREAETMLRRCINVFERTVGPADDKTLEWRKHLTFVLAAEDKDLEAEAEAREIVKVKDKTLGAERDGGPRELLGVVLDKQGKHEEAEAEIRQALQLNEKAFGIDPMDALESRGHLARNLWCQGKNAEAETLLREMITANQKVLGGQVYFLENNVSSRVTEFAAVTPLECQTLLANTLRDQQKYAEAETQYKQVIQLEEKVLGPENRDTLNAYYNYAYQLAQQGKRNEAKALAEPAAKSAEKVLDAHDPSTREYAKFLEILENGQPITTPYMKFHEIFWLGKQT